MATVVPGQNGDSEGAVAEARTVLYGALSTIFAREVTQEAWERMSCRASQSALRRIAKACGVGPEAGVLLGFLARHRREAPATVAEALAVDYARLFVGPGPGLAPPYESFYTGQVPRFYGTAVAEVTALLHEEGVLVDAAFGAPADHLAVELAFMSHLASTGALEGGADGHMSTPRLERQLRFLDVHLLRWVPVWAAVVGQEAATDFYRGGADLLTAFLRADRARLALAMYEVMRRRQADDSDVTHSSGGPGMVNDVAMRKELPE